jgi:hypothetical protein
VASKSFITHPQNPFPATLRTAESKKAETLTLPNSMNANTAEISDHTHTHTQTRKTEHETIAGIEFRPAEIRAAIDDGREWLVKGRTLYFVSHSRNAGFSARPVYKERGNLPLVSRGRFALLDAASANSLVGFELCLAAEGGAK